MAEMVLQKPSIIEIVPNAYNQSSWLDWKFLYHACEYGHIEIVKFFLRKSAEFKIDLNVKDPLSYTPLHHICDHDNPEIVELFIQKSEELGIDLNAKDDYGYFFSEAMISRAHNTVFLGALNGWSKQCSNF